MRVYIDTREKPKAIEKIVAYFDKQGIQHESKALKTGDYMLEGQERLVVDRKQSLQELSANLLSRDRARFYREVKRARAEGIKLIILCEHGRDIKRIEDVKNWKNPYGKVTGKALMDAIYRCSIAYGVEFLFCEKRNTGKRIIELLTEEKENGRG